jgi:tetratricopeptide (TPR) repeat protein
MHLAHNTGGYCDWHSNSSTWAAKVKPELTQGPCDSYTFWRSDLCCKEGKMTAPMLLLMLGFLYTLVFGGLAMLRREGLSVRFAGESVAVTLISVALSYAGISLNPVGFLLIIYLITMRARILVDLGTALAARNRLAWADRVYRFALQLAPDDSARLIVFVNQGVSLIRQNHLEAAVEQFRSVLAEGQAGGLGAKQECACRFNLGVALRKQGDERAAMAEFRTLLDEFPASEYSRYAQAALDKSNHETPEEH